MHEVPHNVRIYSAAPYFYNLSKKVGYTVRYIVRFDEEIDGEALRNAFEYAMKRYPYLRLKLVKGCFSDHLEYNEAPLVVLNTSEALTLGGEQTNGHLLALSYKRRSIYVNNSHGIFDGRGRAPFMRTLIYYYCLLRYDEPVEMENVNLEDSEIDPEEYREPFMQKLPKHRRFGPGVSMPKAMKLSKMGLVKMSDPLIHCMRIDEKELMAWCKQHDATPNVAIAIMMNRAIHKLHPESKLPVGASVNCDLRATLNAPKSHWSLIFLLNLFYDKKIAKLDISDQCTVYRGSLIMQSDPDVLANATSVSKMFYSLVYHVPKPLKQLFCKIMFPILKKPTTFAVSYAGKTTYGSCDKHIRGLYPECNCGYEMNIEITVAGGYFLLDISQMWKEDVYYEAFRCELEANGLHPETTYVYDQRCTLFEV